MRRTALTAAAAAALLVPSGPALAAAHHAAHVGHKPPTGTHGKPARSHGQVRAILRAIGAQGRVVDRLAASAQSSSVLADTDRPAVEAALTGDAQSLADLVAGLGAMPSHADLHRAIGTRKVAQLQAHAGAAVGRVRAGLDAAQAAASALQAQADEAAANGTDETATDSALADAATAGSTGSTAADTALAAALGLSPSATAADRDSARTAAEQALRAALDALTQAQDALTAAQSAYAG